MSPILQVRIAPPVQLPCVEVAETKVLPAGIGSVTVTGPQVRTPAAIEQPFWPQPEPWEAIVQDRPAFVGSVSLSVTPWASPAPALNTVIVNPIGLPTFTFAASAVFTILISAALMVDVSPSSPHVPVDASLFTSPE